MLPTSFSWAYPTLRLATSFLFVFTGLLVMPIRHNIPHSPLHGCGVADDVVAPICLTSGLGYLECVEQKTYTVHASSDPFTIPNHYGHSASSNLHMNLYVRKLSTFASALATHMELSRHPHALATWRGIQDLRIAFIFTEYCDSTNFSKTFFPHAQNDLGDVYHQALHLGKLDPCDGFGPCTGVCFGGTTGYYTYNNSNLFVHQSAPYLLGNTPRNDAFAFFYFDPLQFEFKVGGFVSGRLRAAALYITLRARALARAHPTLVPSCSPCSWLWTSVMLSLFGAYILGLGNLLLWSGTRFRRTVSLVRPRGCLQTFFWFTLLVMCVAPIHGVTCMTCHDGNAGCAGGAACLFLRAAARNGGGVVESV